jgi:hypothetical protein
MSLASWKKEFYRIPASKVSKRNALQHSLKKWIGLKPCNRKKHKVSLVYGSLVDDSDVVAFEEGCRNGYIEIDSFDIDNTTCALCKHFFSSKYLDNHCKDCLLVKANFMSCEDDYSPFDLFVNKGLVSPMITALEKAQEKMRTK